MTSTERYSRHLALPGFTSSHQTRLGRSRVAIVGCGGLGAPVAMYLVAAGIGHIKIVDHDIVSLSNLQRQVLFVEDDIGKSKAQVAVGRLRNLNRECTLIAIEERLNAGNVMQYLANADVILDCSDNFPTRYLICDASVRLGIPVVYAAIHQMEGQVAVFNGRSDINYRDVYMKPPSSGAVLNCEEGGVLGPLAGIVGSMQASEALKLLADFGEISDGKMIHFDGISNRTSIFEIKQNPANSVRRNNADKIEFVDYEVFCGIEKTKLIYMNEITVNELKAMMDAQEDFQLIDVREPFEFEEVNLGALLIPMNRVPDRISEIERNKKVVVHCKAGARSASVIQYLESQHGYKNLANLKGGIMAWEQVYGKP